MSVESIESGALFQGAAPEHSLSSELLEIRRLQEEQEQARGQLVEVSTNPKSTHGEALNLARQYFSEVDDGDVALQIKQLDHDAGGSLLIPPPEGMTPVVRITDAEIIYITEEGRLETYNIPEISEESPADKAEAIRGLRSFLNLLKGTDEVASDAEQAIDEDVRRRLLAAGGGTIASYEVFLRHEVDPDAPMSDGDWGRVEHRASWTNERAERHDQHLEEALTGARAISDNIQRKREQENGSENVRPSIICMRGACGSGKTTAARELVGDSGVNGSIAPDLFKEMLMRDDTSGLTASQLHVESGAMTTWHEMRIVPDPDIRHIVVDRLLSEPEDTLYLIDQAEQTKRDIAYIDADVPLAISCLRVLTRSGGGADPAVPFDSVASSFSRVRNNRLELQDTLAMHATSYQDGWTFSDVADYRLWAWDAEAGMPIQVGELVKAPAGCSIQPVMSEDPAVQEKITQLFQEVSAPSPLDTRSEVDAAAQTVITEEFIDTYIASLSYLRGEAAKPQRDSLRNMYLGAVGKTLKQALDERASKRHG